MPEGPYLQGCAATSWRGEGRYERGTENWCIGHWSRPRDSHTIRNIFHSLPGCSFCFDWIVLTQAKESLCCRGGFGGLGNALRLVPLVVVQYSRSLRPNNQHLEPADRTRCRDDHRRPGMRGTSALWLSDQKTENGKGRLEHDRFGWSYLARPSSLHAEGVSSTRRGGGTGWGGLQSSECSNVFPEPNNNRCWESPHP